MEQVFSNPIVLEAILKHALTDIVEDLKFRTVNRNFNYAFLVVLRQEYRCMDIQFQEAEITNFYINGRKLISTKTPQFFEFSNKVAKLKVQNLSVKNLNWAETRIESELHYVVHWILINGNREHIRKFVGFERTCGGCVECLEIAKTAEEYGPISCRSLARLQKPDKPRKLIITTEFLNFFASEYALRSKSKKDCQQLMSTHIKPDLLSGDTLIFWLSESQTKMGQLATKQHYEIPLEVLEMFIRKWNVKCLRILPVFTYNSLVHDDRWMNSDYFTAVRFTDDSEKKTLIKVSHVQLDLSNSYHCRRDFSYSDIQGYPHRGYSNFIVNIRQLFSSNTISIKNFFKAPSQLLDIYGTFFNILRIVGRSAKHRNQQILELNFEYLLQITDVVKFSNYEENGDDLIYPKIPEIFFKPTPLSVSYRRSFWHIQSTPESVRNMRFVSKKFTIEENGLVFNLSVFLNKDALYHDTSNKKVKEFLRFFT